MADHVPVGTRSNAVAAETGHYLLNAEAGVFSYTTTPAVLVLTPASHYLIAHARTLSAEGRHQFAVLFVHAACELHTEGELIRLLAPRKDRDLVELVLPGKKDMKSLDSRTVRRVYAQLTGDEPEKASWWSDWASSRKDRHAVAHTGAQMTEVQANAAMDACDKYIRHVTEKVEAVLKKISDSRRDQDV